MTIYAISGFVPFLLAIGILGIVSIRWRVLGHEKRRGAILGATLLILIGTLGNALVRH